MIRKHLTLFGYFFLLHSSLCAQNQKNLQFYFSPHIGGEWTLSRFENKKEKSPYIQGATLDLSDKYGVSLMADFNRKVSLELGYGWGNVGWGARYKSQTDSALTEMRGSTALSTTVRRLTLKVSKPLTSVKIKRNLGENSIGRLLNIPDEYRHWVIFDIQLLGGFSYEYIPPAVGGYLGLGWGPSFRRNGTIARDQVTLKDSWDRVHPYGSGVFTGFSLQFYHLGKRKFELGVIYHKGLNKRILVNWETSINGVEFPAFRTFTRGSMIALYLAYPIKLFGIRKSP